MHTSEELRAGSFEIEIDGAPAGIAQLLPGFGEGDRLGVVVRRPFGALGASLLILAAVTAFYERQRARGERFFIYPDFFLFHVGARHGDHSMLDIWPSHKEVVVAADAETLLEAINDRAITRLLVEDHPPAGADGGSGSAAAGASGRFLRETLASARSRIVSTFAYSPSGRVHQADVRIAGNEVTERYVEAALDPDRLLAELDAGSDRYAQAVAQRAGEVAAELRSNLRAARRGLRERGRTLETYRRIPLEQALAALAPPAAA
jgi:hypothetical protein